jgi:hypothetical protein
VIGVARIAQIMACVRMKWKGPSVECLRTCVVGIAVFLATPATAQRPDLLEQGTPILGAATTMAAFKGCGLNYRRSQTEPIPARIICHWRAPRGHIVLANGATFSPTEDFAHIQCQ